MIVELDVIFSEVDNIAHSDLALLSSFAQKDAEISINAIKEDILAQGLGKEIKYKEDNQGMEDLALDGITLDAIDATLGELSSNLGKAPAGPETRGV